MNSDNDVSQIPDVEFSGVASADAVAQEKLMDLMIPGHEAEFSPEEADFAGVFLEDAVSESDARESIIDLDSAMGD